MAIPDYHGYKLLMYRGTIFMEARRAFHKAVDKVPYVATVPALSYLLLDQLQGVWAVMK